MKEDSDKEYKVPLPIFSLSQFEAPECFQTPKSKLITGKTMPEMIGRN